MNRLRTLLIASTAMIQAVTPATLAFIAAPLVGCTISSDNGTTKVTLNVAEVDAWAQAINNAGAILLPLLPVPAAPAIQVVMAKVAADIAAWDQAASGQTSVTFDTGSAPAALKSLLDDGQTLLAQTRASLGASVPAGTQQTLTALQTVLSILAAQVGTLPVAAAIGGPSMTEATALQVLGVK